MSEVLQVVATVAAAVAAGAALKTAQATKRLADDNVKQSEALRIPNLIVTGGLNGGGILNLSLHVVFIHLIYALPEGCSDLDGRHSVFLELDAERLPNTLDPKAAHLTAFVLKPNEERAFILQDGPVKLISPDNSEVIPWTLRIGFDYPLHPQGATQLGRAVQGLPKGGRCLAAH